MDSLSRCIISVTYVTYTCMMQFGLEWNKYQCRMCQSKNMRDWREIKSLVYLHRPLERAPKHCKYQRKIMSRNGISHLKCKQLVLANVTMAQTVQEMCGIYRISHKKLNIEGKSIIYCTMCREWPWVYISLRVLRADTNYISSNYMYYVCTYVHTRIFFPLLIDWLHII